MYNIQGKWQGHLCNKSRDPKGDNWVLTVVHADHDRTWLTPILVQASNIRRGAMRTDWPPHLSNVYPEGGWSSKTSSMMF
eukprot:6298287-Heterocapsa_arctica.AAC.1